MVLLNKKIDTYQKSLRSHCFKEYSQVKLGRGSFGCCPLTKSTSLQVLGQKSPMVVFSKFLILNFMDFANSLLEVFGCVSFVHIHAQHCGKLNLQALECFFVGHSTTKKKGYKVYHLATRRFSTSIEVIFSKKKYFFPSPYL